MAKKKKIESSAVTCYGGGSGNGTGSDHRWEPIKSGAGKVLGRQCGACHRTEVFAACPDCGFAARVELHDRNFCKCQSAAAKGGI
jgi:hypothetical protein